MRNTPAIEGGTPVRDNALPFFRASLGESDIAKVIEVLKTGWITGGPATLGFENQLAAYTGARHVIAVSSCSEAMFLSLKALGVGPGDEVITTTLTFASTIHAIIHTGATPVLVDVEPVTLGMDPVAVEARISDKTKAILPVHFAGQACNIKAICDLASRRGLYVVEDAAHSLGADVNGKQVGTFGDATAFSFYATKNITTAEGGAISTDDDDLASALKLWSYHGMSRDSWSRYTDKGSWFYQVVLPGYKCNMNDVLAALGQAQMEKLDHLLARRQEIAGRFTDAFAGSPHVTVPKVGPGNRHTWHLYVIQLNLPSLTIDRDRFINAMTAEGIGSSVHFIPVHTHPFYAGYLTKDDKFPVCEDYYRSCISLPIYPDMTESDIEDVVTAVNRIAHHYSQ